MSDNTEVTEVTDLNLRAIRVIETRLSNLLGGISTEEAVDLLALEMSEVAEPLSLVSALAAVGAATIILMAHELGADPACVVTQVRRVMTPAE